MAPSRPSSCRPATTTRPGSPAGTCARTSRTKPSSGFKDRDDRLSVLVVCDVLLTGFDAPVEQVLCLDAPLKEHTLLQAIACVNRPLGEEKTHGLVVDYWGVSAKLQDAMAVFSTTDVAGGADAERRRASAA